MTAFVRCCRRRAWSGCSGHIRVFASWSRRRRRRAPAPAAMNLRPACCPPARALAGPAARSTRDASWGREGRRPCRRHHRCIRSPRSLPRPRVRAALGPRPVGPEQHHKWSSIGSPRGARPDPALGNTIVHFGAAALPARLSLWLIAPGRLAPRSGAPKYFSKELRGSRTVRPHPCSRAGFASCASRACEADSLERGWRSTLPAGNGVMDWQPAGVGARLVAPVHDDYVETPADAAGMTSVFEASGSDLATSSL